MSLEMQLQKRRGRVITRHQQQSCELVVCHKSSPKKKKKKPTENITASQVPSRLPSPGPMKQSGGSVCLCTLEKPDWSGVSNSLCAWLSLIRTSPGEKQKLREIFRECTEKDMAWNINRAETSAGVEFIEHDLSNHTADRCRRTDL